MGQTNDKSASKRTPAKAGKQAARFDGSRFVNYELDLSEQAACKGWSVTADDLWGDVLALLDDGYSITAKFDSYSDAYACFVQVRGQEDHANAGLILTGRGSTPFKAVKQAIFKHRTIGPSWVQYAERRSPVVDD